MSHFLYPSLGSAGPETNLLFPVGEVIVCTANDIDMFWTWNPAEEQREPNVLGPTSDIACEAQDLPHLSDHVVSKKTHPPIQTIRRAERSVTLSTIHI